MADGPSDRVAPHGPLTFMPVALAAHVPHPETSQPGRAARLREHLFN